MKTRQSSLEEKKAQSRARNKRYRLAHKERCRAYAQAYREAHKKPIRQPPTVKTCQECNLQKPLSDFGKVGRVTGVRSTRGGFGVTPMCKACRSHLRKPTLKDERAERSRLIAQNTKACGVCREIKPRDAFHVRKRSIDGVSYTCKACTKIRSDAWRKNNPSANKDWYYKNREYQRKRWAQWRAANGEHCRATFKRWAKLNPDRIRALIARRNAAKLKATPKWADKDAIRAIYREAIRLTKETGVRYEVDHIVPLRSKLVCGLHVEANLQILTREENKRKSNRLHAA